MIRLRRLHPTFELVCNNILIVGYQLCFLYAFRGFVQISTQYCVPSYYKYISARLFLDYYPIPGGVTLYKDMIVQTFRSTREPLIHCSVYDYPIGTHIYRIPT